MLNRLDDYPIHQTTEPLAHPATSDRNHYDRTWFNGYAKDASYYFALGMAVYPHRQVQDCAFSMVTPNGRQHCFYGSRRAPDERTDMSVGPMRIEVDVPMRRTRVILDDNTSGLACDLTFSARTGAIQEARQILTHRTRAVMDATRFAQFGRWQGTIHGPDGDIAVDAKQCHGTKDRSWGIRGVGEPETGGAPHTPGGAFFLWAPLIWDDHISHAIFFDDNRGQPLVREGLTSPLYENESDIPAVEDPHTERMATAIHRVQYHQGTRLAASAELDLIDVGGDTRNITMEPLLRFHMKGLGYGHPKWRQGNWMGELEIGGESFDPEALDLLRPENLHVQQVVQVSDGDRTGIGALEQIVIGPYAPAGFKEHFDGSSQ